MPNDIKYRDAERILKQNGFEFSRHKGSHKIFVRAKDEFLIIPVHSKSIKSCIWSKIKKRYDIKE